MSVSNFFSLLMSYDTISYTYASIEISKCNTFKTHALA